MAPGQRHNNIQYTWTERESERERVSSIIGFEGMKQSLLFVITEYNILFNNFLERQITICILSFSHLN